MSNQFYFLGTRTSFIRAAPKIFCRVNGALISNNKCINGSWEVRLTWLDCNQRSYIWIFGWTSREDIL